MTRSRDLLHVSIDFPDDVKGLLGVAAGAQNIIGALFEQVLEVGRSPQYPNAESRTVEETESAANR